MFPVYPRIFRGGLYFFEKLMYTVSMAKNNTRPEASGIAGILCQIKSQTEMERFLKEIMTPAELYDLALRWELMHKLSQGLSQRQIASELGISLCKITRGAKILKDLQSISRKFLEERKSL
jgi:TrpR family transcriptional regulator, trp operon repressor